MRRLTNPLIALFLIGLCALAPAGCKRKKRPAQAADEEPAGLATMVHAADPRTATQLVRGFHNVEQNAWRWTEGKFAVVLKPPAGAAQKGAILELKFDIPDVVIEKLGSITLSASLNGRPLPPETYTKAGQYTYSREIAPGILSGDGANVEFTLDKFLPANAQDQRDLGVVMSMVGFEARQ